MKVWLTNSKSAKKRLRMGAFGLPERRDRVKLEMELVRPARKNGWDRYEAEVGGTEGSLVIYFPQWISRKDGIPKKTIKLEIK